MLTKLELSIKTFTFFSAAANALGIGAASFWSVSGKRYSGKPDGDSRNAQNNVKLTINNG